MASILILSEHGDGIPIGIRMSREGHIVKFWIKQTNARNQLKGFRNPSVVGDPRRLLEQYDLIIADMVGMGEICDEMMEKGKLVIGGGIFNDKLEEDRYYGEKVASNLLKARVPESVSCNTKEELMQYLESSTTPMVIKPNGNKPVGLTLVSKDPLNRMLKGVVKLRGDELVPCIVQEMKEGIEISTEGWFNGEDFVKPFNHTIEKKRFMNENHGPNTGCMGNVVWCVKESDKLIESILIPLKPLSKKVNYVGPIDVNCIINEQEIWFLEFTARLGYEAIQSFLSLLNVSTFDFFYFIASRQKAFIPHSSDYSMAIRLSLPPYPTIKGAENWKGIQVLDVSDEAKKHVWLSDVMKDSGIDVMAGTDGVIGCVTARGKSPNECQRRILRTIKRISLTEDIQYRTDIADWVEENKRKLIEWGWLNG